MDASATSIGLPRSTWIWVTSALALLLALPLASVAWSLLQDTTPLWAQTLSLALPRYAVNSLLLSGLVAIGVFVIGSGTAWLVVMYRFPGRAILEPLLAIPLAMPAYIMAYASAYSLQFSGPVQSALRSVFGLSAGEYWFPEIRSVPGAAFVLTLALYPYVYLLARASFIEQSAAALEVGRSLGRGPWRLFRDVGLPLARPALIAGTGLAAMETLADYGTVDYLGVQTFTTGIYRAYFSFGDPVAAAQLATALLSVVVLAAIFIQVLRGRGLTGRMGRSQRRLSTMELTGVPAALAAMACFLPPFMGFFAPLWVLIDLAISHDTFDLSRLGGLAANSIGLALGASVLTVCIALIFAYAARVTRARAVRVLTNLASFNYAVPGSIIAIGLIGPLTLADRWMSGAFGLGPVLLLSGSLAALTYLYVARFFAAAHGAASASLARVTRTMDWAARSLGKSALASVWRVHIPVMWPSLLTAALIVFVEVIKELPGTLILRPFNFDTLAVAAYHLAADERIAELGAPAVVIVAAGLLPILILMRSISGGSPGGFNRAHTADEI
jgi:iron(III) transport system permease protein